MRNFYFKIDASIHFCSLKTTTLQSSKFEHSDYLFFIFFFKFFLSKKRFSYQTFPTRLNPAVTLYFPVKYLITNKRMILSMQLKKKKKNVMCGSHACSIALTFYLEKGFQPCLPTERLISGVPFLKVGENIKKFTNK